MKIIIFIGLLGLFCSFNCDEINLFCTHENYTNIIKNLYHTFNGSGVILITDNNKQAWTGYNFILMHDLSKLLIPTMSLALPDLAKWIKLYRIKVRLPMIVLPVDNIHYMKSIMMNIDITYPIWLIMSYSKDDDECNYCRAPESNTLNLTYNVRMYVWCCCHNNPLFEWWSINGTDIQYAAVGNFKYNETALIKKNYPQRRNFNNIQLRIVFHKFSSAIWINRYGQYVGILYDVVVELGYALNFSIGLKIRIDPINPNDTNLKNFTGISDMISRRYVDIGLTEMPFTMAQSKRVDFTSAIILTQYRLYFRTSHGETIRWLSYFQVFQSRIWLIIVTILITISPLLALAELNVPRTDISSTIIDHYLNIMSVICQQGMPVFPTKTSLRIAYFVLNLCSVIIFASYSAGLISFLTITEEILPFHSLKEFSLQNSWNLITLRDSAEYEMFELNRYSNHSLNVILKRMKKKMLPRNKLPVLIHFALRKICTENVALFAKEIEIVILRTYMKCQTGSIPTPLTGSWSMILKRNSPYKELFNLYIHKFHANGMLDRIQSKYSYHKEILVNDYYSVSIYGVVPVLVIILIGNVIGLIVLEIEKYYFMRSNSRSRIKRRK